MKNIVFFIFCAVFIGCGTADKKAAIALADSNMVKVVSKNTNSSSINETHSYAEDIDTFNYIPDEIRNFKPPKLIEKK